MKKNKFQWMYSDTEYDNGKIDIHFILDLETGNVIKQVQRRTSYKSNSEEKVNDLYEDGEYIQ